MSEYKNSEGDLLNKGELLIKIKSQDKETSYIRVTKENIPELVELLITYSKNI